MSKIRNTTAQIAAAAVFEAFPSVQIWSTQETSVGFSCDLFFPHPIHSELHFLIEERMRQIIREKREIRDLEMVPFSAREFLKSKGHQISLKELEGEGLVRIVQMGSFCNRSAGTHLNNSSELAAFKLFPLEVLEGRGLRISGTAHPSKQEMKLFLKKWSAYPKIRHEKVGENQDLWRFIDETLIWLPKGIQLREKLLRIFKENLFEGAYEIALPQGCAKMVGQIIREKLNRPIAEVALIENIDGEGLFLPRMGTVIQLSSSFGNTISSLQSISKTLNILGFNYCIRLIGPKNKDRVRILAQALEQLQWDYERDLEERESPQVQFLVADGLGRMWSAATVCANEFLVCQVIVERNLALLLELQEPLAISLGKTQ